MPLISNFSIPAAYPEDGRSIPSAPHVLRLRSLEPMEERQYAGSNGEFAVPKAELL